jgi:Raf kinase inhibitor-like YbhB/YbcL family protein
MPSGSWALALRRHSDRTERGVVMSQSQATEPAASSPYTYLPTVPSFQLSSETVAGGAPLPIAQWSKLLGVPGGEDISPQLSWSGFPAETKSFVVSMYDPQAPTGSGFWHWVVADIPASVTSLRAGAGAADAANLPDGAFQLAGDAGAHQFVGAAPPPHSGIHNYYLTVTALDIDTAGLDRNASAAYMGFAVAGHTIARAFIVCPTAAGE